MIKKYPRGLSFSPFAIKFDFVSNYSVEDCKTRLQQIQTTPSRWKKFLGAVYLKINVIPSDNADIWKFEAERKVSKTDIKARGYIQEISVTTTSVSGYSDTTPGIYLILLLLLLIFIRQASILNNGTKDGLLVSGALVGMGLFSTLLNILFIRRQAKKLVDIIEETLKT